MYKVRLKQWAECQRIRNVFVKRFAAIHASAFALTVAVLGDEFVCHDPAQPRLAVCPGFVFFKISASADKRILDEIFGILVVMGQMKRIRHQRIFVAQGFGLKQLEF